MKTRLQKIIAEAGLTSRRQAERWILDGKVRVNGQVVTRLGTLADPAEDAIQVNGRTLPPPRDFVYLILNKPADCVTTTKDDRERPTVMHCIKKVRQRVFPVGRLDFNTQGVLLFTSDGALAKKLLEPKSRVVRTYQARVRGIPEEAALEQLRRGVRLDKKPTAPMQVEIARTTGKNAVLTLKLTEGKNHHIKRVCEKVGHPVIKLKRTHFAFLSLLDLPPGKFRWLTPREIKRLKALVS